MKQEALLPNFDKVGGLIPVIVQDAKSLDVLMTAFMNKESYKITLEIKEMVYFSRSRQKLWHKGETSGNTQTLVEMRIDCDKDALLAKVIQRGNAACHTGFRSCFHNIIDDESTCHKDGVRVFDPDLVYSKK